MIDKVKNANILIVGGGSLCKELILSFFGNVFKGCCPHILGVIDFNTEAPGMNFARFNGYNTYHQYGWIDIFYKIDLIIITVDDPRYRKIINNIKKKLKMKVNVLDSLQSVSLVDLITIKEMEGSLLESLNKKGFNEKKEIIKKFEIFFQKTREIVFKKNNYLHEIRFETEGISNKQNYIIQSIAIPTFVINNDHFITHWNYAVEKMTGYKSSKMLGTNKQWLPFYQKPMSTMADAVLDKSLNLNFKNIYGGQWQKSEFIEGGYESEVFFPKMGKKGKWLFFTAAPIKTIYGVVIGAVETIWDVTESKNIDKERKRYITKIEDKERTLAQIIQGSTIPTFIINSEHLITHWNSAVEKMTGYKSSKMVGTNKQWLPFWQKPRPTMADAVLDQTGQYELKNLYGGKWRKSELIEGGYEAELFFPKMGKKGKWLFFTATPIKSINGVVIGAIETLWDTTDHRRAEVQRKRYTSRLEDKERELAQIIQGSTAPTFVINKDHIITHWNHALEKLTGFRAIDMIGTSNHWKPFFKKKQPIMADVILNKFMTGKMDSSYNSKWRESSSIEGGYEFEEFFAKIGESGKWLFFTAAPIKTSYNSIDAVIQTFWDVSLAKQAENDRRRYTNELATLCSMYTVLNAPLPLKIRIQNTIQEIRKFVTASSLCIYMSNSKGQFGLSYFDSCIQGEGIVLNKSKIDDEIIKQVSKVKKPIIVECEQVIGKGSLEIVYIPIFAKHRRRFGVMQIAKRLGHFKSDDLHLLDLMGNRIGVAVENSILHEELERKSKFQSKLIKSANDGIIATDDRWKTVIFNSAAEKIFGYKAGISSNEKDIRKFFPQKSLDILYNSAFLSTSEDSSPWFEMEIFTKKRKLVPVRFSGSILRDKNKMIGAVAFFQDLREIKRLEGELVQSEKLAAVGQTVAGMAHCIKNILHGFKGGRYLMDVGTNKNDIDKIKNGWGMIQRNINRTSDLVMDLLSYSKERKPEIEICNPNEILEDVYQLLNGLATEHGIQLIRFCSKEINLFNLDSKIMHRCLMNLVTNAIDACLFDDIEKEHKVILKIRIKSNNYIEFSVKDNGCGMTDEVKSKLFSSLFSTKGIKGTGLGLLVTAKLVEEHSGSIKVISKISEGTIFKVEIPPNLVLKG